MGEGRFTQAKRSWGTYLAGLLLITLILATSSSFSAHATSAKSATSSISSTAAQPRWDEHLNLGQIVHRLHTEPIKSVVDLHKALGVESGQEVFLVTFKSGLKAVFKPGVTRWAEVAAYRASEWFVRAAKERAPGLVPPTVHRIIKGRPGSLQFFVDPDAAGAPQRVTKKDLSEVNLWRFIFGMWDTHTGNRILQTNNHRTRMALIDNAGLTVPLHSKYGQFPYWQLGHSHATTGPANHTRTFPFYAAKTVKKTTRAALAKLFHNYLGPARSSTVFNIYSRIVYVVWHNQLWLQSRKSYFSRSYTTDYYRSEIDAYKSLNMQTLRKIWGENALRSKAVGRQLPALFALVLDRRNQVVKAAKVFQPG